jgi:hypothetical protein
MDGQNGVARVVLLEEQGPKLGLLQGLLEPGHRGLALRVDVLAFVGELDEDLELFLLGEDLPEEQDVLFEQLLLLLEGLGGLLILPDVGRS